VSGDPFKLGEAKIAGTGKVPEQSVIPKEVAEQFLSEDGKYWQPWREIGSTEAVTTLNIFRMKQKYALPTVTVAMRVPYTYTYLQLFIQRLQQSKLLGVGVDEVGLTPEGRKLQVIRIEPPTVDHTDLPSILIIAREHATEHASSWALHGALTRVLIESSNGGSLCKDKTWLFIPIQDPDGSSHAIFDRQTETFRSGAREDVLSEVISYSRYFADYVGTDRTIDVSATLHNIEVNEGSQFLCPFVDMRMKESSIQFNRHIFKQLAADGYIVNDPNVPWAQGFIPFRLYGWIADHFKSYDLAYEVNDRYPQQRLSLLRVQRLGAIIAAAVNDWQNSEEGIAWHHRAKRAIYLHKLARLAYFERQGYDPQLRTTNDSIQFGY